MCGICGIVATDPNYPIGESTILTMRDSLVHRGPDGAGHYVGRGVGLGSRRLAILDLSRNGQMPMATPDGRYWIVYNGEVYNYRELRGSLEQRGYKFRSNTDTEVLLYLFEAEGPAMLDRLNGMFAFAVWDNHERCLFLARDRLGVKPLYYVCAPDALYFASEEKALFAADLTPVFDHDTWEELLCFRYVAGERTPFVGVQRLLPGHYLIWKDGHLRVRRWWSLIERAQKWRETLPGDPIAWFRETFDSAVDLRRISDVPVGVLLSGGLDSSSVAASLGEQAGAGVASFTVRFDDPDYDEGPLARQIVSRWQLDPYELRISPDDLLTQLSQASWFNDEPLAHGNDVYLLAIARYAKPKVTVLLSGEGADEVVGGYVRYHPLRFPGLLALMQPWLLRLGEAGYLNRRWRKLGRFLRLGTLDRFVLFNACDVLPEDMKNLGLSQRAQFSYRESVLAEARQLYPNELARQAMYSDQHTFLCSVLDRNDRMTMGASIECRVPFLDYRLVEIAAALPTSSLFQGFKGKALLRSAVGYRLPQDILAHRKWGFGVPWLRYLRQVESLREILLDLPKDSLLSNSPLDRSLIQQLVGRFLSGDDRPLPILLQLLMIVVSWSTVSKNRKPMNGHLPHSKHVHRLTVERSNIGL